ncbi:MAG: acyltransferase, partial [Selenomonadaceae bacterium]|nr:acyltransferase [Selenomonadaceae bacterium]
LAHPIAIGYFSLWLTNHNYIMTAPLAIAYYFAVLFASVLSAALCRKIGERIPVLNELTIGVYQKKKG